MDKLDLKSLFLQNPDCVYSRKKLRATLQDLYPNNKQDVNIVLLIYDSRLLEKFRGKDTLDPLETAAMCSKIENEYGIPPELTVKAIASWGEVFGTSVSEEIMQTPKTAPYMAPQPVTKPTSTPIAKSASTPAAKSVVSSELSPIRPVQGSTSEYVIEEKAGGWFITKYQGFDQETITVPNIIDGKQIVGLQRCVFQGCREIIDANVSEGIRF